MAEILEVNTAHIVIEKMGSFDPEGPNLQMTEIPHLSEIQFIVSFFSKNK